MESHKEKGNTTKKDEGTIFDIITDVLVNNIDQRKDKNERQTSRAIRKLFLLENGEQTTQETSIARKNLQHHNIRVYDGTNFIQNTIASLRQRYQNPSKQIKSETLLTEIIHALLYLGRNTARIKTKEPKKRSRAIQYREMEEKENLQGLYNMITAVEEILFHGTGKEQAQLSLQYQSIQEANELHPESIWDVVDICLFSIHSQIRKNNPERKRILYKIHIWNVIRKIRKTCKKIIRKLEKISDK